MRVSYVSVRVSASFIFQFTLSYSAGSQAPAWELRQEAPASCYFYEARASKVGSQAGAWEPATRWIILLKSSTVSFVLSKLRMTPISLN